MKLSIIDANGTILGQIEMWGTRWRGTHEGFVNAEMITIDLDTGGIPTHFMIGKNTEAHTIGAVSLNEKGLIPAGSPVHFPPGFLSLSIYQEESEDDPVSLPQEPSASE